MLFVSARAFNRVAGSSGCRSPFPTPRRGLPNRPACWIRWSPLRLLQQPRASTGTARAYARGCSPPDRIPWPTMRCWSWCCSLPSRGATPSRIGRQLLATFGSFSGAIAAPVAELRRVEGLGDAGVAALKTVQAAALRLARGEVLGKPVLKNWDALMDYLNAAMARERVEQFRILFLDHRNRLIADEAADPRHRQPHARLPPRGRAPGARAQRQRPDPGAQPPERRPHALGRRRRDHPRDRRRGRCRGRAAARPRDRRQRRLGQPAAGRPAGLTRVSAS